MTSNHIGLESLESLFLQENQLVSIEYEGGFDTLVWMNLNYNQITAVRPPPLSSYQVK